MYGKMALCTMEIGLKTKLKAKELINGRTVDTMKVNGKTILKMARVITLGQMEGGTLESM